MSPADLQTADSRTKTYHRIIEAFKFGFAKKTKLADPDFEDISQVRFLIKSFTSVSFQEYGKWSVLALSY